ncbi:unnamed protein product [Allacma fusca]|uniref:Uncharacterized protein n=1 Tax=Allacma fusca TaxID=39272 RepID=A0A8J2LQ85_9HEXA|nr:unnamed protein product [Allacma fusca]
MGVLKQKLVSFCVLLIHMYIVTVESYPHHNLEGFHDLHETDVSFDLNEEESKILSTAIPPPEDHFLRGNPEESRTEETTIPKPENDTESYEATTEPLVIISQRYQIQVTDKKSLTKRNNDERGGKLNHPESDDEESTPAYGVLENASVSTSEDERKNTTVAFQSCGHEVMETEKPILKHSELEDGVLHEAKRNPLPDFEETTLKDLDDQTLTTLSNSHESNAVQLKEETPTEAYTAQETQIVVEDTQKPEILEKDETKAGTDLAIVIKPPSLIGGHLNQSNGTTRVHRGELTATEATVEVDASAEVKSEENEAADIGSTDEPIPASHDDEPHKEFEDEPVPVESSEVDGMKDAEVVTIPLRPKAGCPQKPKNSRTDWTKFVKNLLPKTSLDVEAFFLTAIKLF